MKDLEKTTVKYWRGINLTPQNNDNICKVTGELNVNLNGGMLLGISVQKNSLEWQCANCLSWNPASLSICLNCCKYLNIKK